MCKETGSSSRRQSEWKLRFAPDDCQISSSRIPNLQTADWFACRGSFETLRDVWFLVSVTLPPLMDISRVSRSLKASKFISFTPESAGRRSKPTFYLLWHGEHLRGAALSSPPEWSAFPFAHRRSEFIRQCFQNRREPSLFEWRPMSGILSHHLERYYQQRQIQQRFKGRCLRQNQQTSVLMMQNLRKMHQKLWCS